ncbi:MAG: DMT family transporter [Eggerthellaceae bacterium]|nr:DMT family transporter [Eggerthellaceae bacterium]
MRYGFGAALTWAFDTVILGIALSNVVFLDSPTAIALASFTSTFLHDGMSAIYMFIYMAIRKKLKKTWQLLMSKQGKFIVIAALIGAPFGMSGYVMAIDNIGPAYTAAISAFFPAYGTLLSTIFLKQKMKWYQWLGLAACLAGVAVLGWTPDEGVKGSWMLGIIGALITVIGWGTEAVIIDWALHGSDADDECCLQIRQATSGITYALILLPLLGGWGVTLHAAASSAMPIIALASLIGTISYLFYYKAIDRIGAAKSMALNITYSAWAIPVSLALLGTMPDLRGIICAIVIIVGAIVAAADLKELFSKN